MSRFPISPSNANIPIYLDAAVDSESEKRKEAPSYICPTCETDSRDQPIHCISLSSPAPPSYSAIAAPSATSRHLAVPSLSLQTPRNLSGPFPSPPRRAFQFDPEGRPQVRFRRNAFSPLSPAIRNEDVDWGRKSNIGLGIPEAKFQPDLSPITPGTAEKKGEEKVTEEPANLNFAQRIEQKLWKYSASGNVWKRWLLEIISWTVSALSMAGIIGMLIYYKDKRIPNWPLGLTLNAYISVLSKVASAALLLPISEALGQLKWSWFRGGKSQKMWDFEIFDEASRGPWGSLLLLLRTKGKSLAALGAAVTLFALALDPFFQQVASYPEHWRLQPGYGSIPRAQKYEPFNTGKEYREGNENLMLDQNLMAVASHYFYDNGTLPITFGKGIRAEVPLACPNSNCTWPEYETLGMCNKCAEVTDNLEFMCLNTTMDWVELPGKDDLDEASYDNGTSCGWYLKADMPQLMTGYNVDSEGPHVGEVLLGRSIPLYDIFTREVLPGYHAKLNYSRNPLFHAVIVSGRNLSEIHRNATPIAHECILSWCVKTIISDYSEGGYTEVVKDTTVNETLTTTESTWTIYPTYNENNKLAGTYYIYNENVTVVGKSGEEFTVDNGTHILTLSVFDEIFPSSYVLANSTNETDAMFRFREWITMGPYTRNLTYNPFMHENVSEHFDKMATAMTNLVRSSPSSSEMISGPAYDKESFVDVRWAWLTLPLALLALTFFFLAATIIRSSIELEHVGVWKTSAIATLLYGLPDQMQAEIATSEANGTPRAKAKEIKVKWAPKAGWRFSGNGFSPTNRQPRQPGASSRGWI